MVLNRKTGKSIATAVLILFLLAILIYYYLLPGIASFLVFRTDLKHADVIIILGGDSERVPYGVKLYKSNFSDKIIVTGGPPSFKQHDMGRAGKGRSGRLRRCAERRYPGR